jgi:predicted adenylyl cyclase CyaB
MSHLNVEIKARCESKDPIRKILETKGADYIGTDHQTDIYFSVSTGRIKLRKGAIENYLIHYDREDKEGPKESKVTLHKTERGRTLERVLRNSHDVLVEVRKIREIYFIGNVKFHLDRVFDLGIFVEIEASDESGVIGREKLLEQCDDYMKLFGIKPEDLIDVSYSDMLMENDL